MAKIIGVGHCCYDYLCTVEEYPAEDSSTHILSISNQGGGAVGTAMVAAARQGIEAGMIANLGDDEVGRLIRRGFEEEEVDLSSVVTVPGGRSSVSYVMVDTAKGTRTKFPYRDELPPIEWNATQREALRTAEILHLDGTHYENALTAARLAKEYGTLISLDGCSMQKDNAKNRALAAMADILIMNARYPYRVAETDDLESALHYFGSLGPAVVISTGGSEGCTALLHGKIVHFPSFSVKAVDTTGAGDVFHGAFLSQYLSGASVEVCIRYASATSALKCMEMGGRSGIPTREKVLSFLATH